VQPRLFDKSKITESGLKFNAAAAYSKTFGTGRTFQLEDLWLKLELRLKAIMSRFVGWYLVNSELK
jgi:hypothetical protein